MLATNVPFPPSPLRRLIAESEKRIDKKISALIDECQYPQYPMTYEFDAYYNFIMVDYERDIEWMDKPYQYDYKYAEQMQRLKRVFAKDSNGVVISGDNDASIKIENCYFHTTWTSIR